MGQRKVLGMCLYSLLSFHGTRSRVDILECTCATLRGKEVWTTVQTTNYKWRAAKVNGEARSLDAPLSIYPIWPV